VQYDYEPAAVAEGTRQMQAVGTQNARLRAGDLGVLRDVYYTAGGSGQYQLGEQEYFLLGDNSPHSHDSRAWSPRGGVAGSLLLGPALCWKVDR
jgi:signal peptidase I